MQSDSAKEKLGTTQLLFAYAQRMGLQPNWVKPNALFAISVNNVERYVYFARSPLNPHVGASIARDKNLTRLILSRHTLQNIPFVLPVTIEEAKIFLETHHKIIAKPCTGSGSRDIHIVTTHDQLAELDISCYILEKYIAGEEYRYLVLNDAVIGVHRSDYGTSVEENRYLERISYSPEEWDQDLIDTSLQATQAVGLNFAAVDFMIDKQGKAYILEINSAPGLKWFHAPTAGPIVNVAQQFLKAFVKNIETTQAESLRQRRVPALSGAR